MIMRIKATEASIASEEIERMAERYQGKNVVEVHIWHIGSHFGIQKIPKNRPNICF